MFDGLGLIREFLFTIDSIIYKVVELAFTLFYEMAGLEWNQFGDAVSGFYERIQSLFAIIMVFYILFVLLQWLVDPDKVIGGGAYKLVQRIAVSILLLVLLPTVFNLMGTIQKEIIAGDTINKIIAGDVPSSVQVGNTGSGNITLDTDLDSRDELAKKMARGVLRGFLGNNGIAGECLTIYNSVFGENPSMDYDALTKENCFKNKNVNGDYQISYTPFLSALIGGYIAFMAVMYCIELGFRVIKILLLQLIAPIPILSHIVGNSAFEKWIQEVISTYISLFIRIAVFSFVRLVLEIIIGNNAMDLGLDLKTIFIILGVITFGKQAPKLISDLFGLKGDGLDFGGKGTLTALTGAATGAAALGKKAMALPGQAANLAKNAAALPGKALDGAMNATANLKNSIAGAGNILGGMARGAHASSAMAGGSMIAGIGGAMYGAMGASAQNKERKAAQTAANAKRGEARSAFGSALMAGMAGGQGIKASMSTGMEASRQVMNKAATSGRNEFINQRDGIKEKSIDEQQLDMLNNIAARMAPMDNSKQVENSPKMQYVDVGDDVNDEFYMP